jgi:hypothetical protein
MVLMRETIFKAAEEAGFVNIKSCCNVPLKCCGTDEWRGDISAFSAALIRLLTPDTDQG